MDSLNIILSYSDQTFSDAEKEVMAEEKNELYREYLNLPPCECIVVEDAEAGIDAGNAGGFATVGIGCAENYNKTKYPIKSLAELLKLV